MAEARVERRLAAILAARCRGLLASGSRSRVGVDRVTTSFMTGRLY